MWQSTRFYSVLLSCFLAMAIPFLEAVPVLPGTHISSVLPSCSFILIYCFFILHPPFYAFFPLILAGLMTDIISTAPFAFYTNLYFFSMIPMYYYDKVSQNYSFYIALLFAGIPLVLKLLLESIFISVLYSASTAVTVAMEEGLIELILTWAVLPLPLVILQLLPVRFLRPLKT